MDTLAFDTVFSSVGSTTRQFMVYNPNNEPLEMEQVMLASGEASGFRMNLDGRKGSRFDRVGIAAHDSMYVFVEVTVNPNGQNQPLLICKKSAAKFMLVLKNTHQRLFMPQALPV